MKKPIDPEELENDMNKVLSFINNLENLNIEDSDHLDKLQNQAESLENILKTQYKDYLDGQE